MQKTEIKYYCDGCGKEIHGFMFSLEFEWGFHAQPETGGFKTVETGDEPTKHYCYQCSRKKVDALGLTVAGVSALLEGGVKNG